MPFDRRVTLLHRINPQPNHMMFQKFDYYFLFASFASFLASVGLWFLVNRDYGVYVGLWVPSILVLWVGVRLTLLARVTPTINRRN
jgi:hypothetical protein